MRKAGVRNILWRHHFLHFCLTLYKGIGGNVTEAVADLGLSGRSVVLPLYSCSGEIFGATGFLDGECWLSLGILPWWWYHLWKYGLRLISAWCHHLMWMRCGFVGQIHPCNFPYWSSWGWCCRFCRCFGYTCCAVNHNMSEIIFWAIICSSTRDDKGATGSGLRRKDMSYEDSVGALSAN